MKPLRIGLCQILVGSDKKLNLEAASKAVKEGTICLLFKNIRKIANRRT